MDEVQACFPLIILAPPLSSLLPRWDLADSTKQVNFNKDKCQAALGWGSAGCMDRLEKERMESSCGKGPEVLIHGQLDLRDRRDTHVLGGQSQHGQPGERGDCPTVVGQFWVPQPNKDLKL